MSIKTSKPGILREARNLVDKKIIRFFLVSGLNTAFGYGIFALLIFFGIKYTLAVLISTIAGILFNFKTIGILVFNSHDNILILKFFLVYVITYILNVIGLTILQRNGLNAYVSGAILVIPVGLLGYLMHKFFVFNKSNRVEKKEVA